MEQQQLDARRIFIDKQTPDVYKAMNSVAVAVRSAADDAGLSRILLELINVRVSQINRCVFCLNLHSQRALEAGDTMQRLMVLPAWRETTLFDADERAALVLAEAVTTVDGEHIDDDAYSTAAKDLTEDQLSVAIWAAVTINAFNRVSILSRHPIRAQSAG
ncbi:carboxymuconolactone decarboxylase family protein [Antrihabitans cavernicola]|uniref:Carboxymuconolactone decarboxylase family protein n=1 Tax=Antrihabitans cavernicola TaxID=2495913 RepID=A0A5A7SAW8_9NOCA|nr:carboxymuconolactone decarboxylase family protein [Spelaeibacter cavernicola]KAA0021713.1 carboxymuconolactone decarboxylase family protein [Spelaeibacter cavernicola]